MAPPERRHRLVPVQLPLEDVGRARRHRDLRLPAEGVASARRVRHVHHHVPAHVRSRDERLARLDRVGPQLPRAHPQAEDRAAAVHRLRERERVAASRPDVRVHRPAEGVGGGVIDVPPGRVDAERPDRHAAGTRAAQRVALDPCRAEAALDVEDEAVAQGVRRRHAGTVRPRHDLRPRGGVPARSAAIRDDEALPHRRSAVCHGSVVSSRRYVMPGRSGCSTAMTAPSPGSTRATPAPKRTASGSVGGEDGCREDRAYSRPAQTVTRSIDRPALVATSHAAWSSLSVQMSRTTITPPSRSTVQPAFLAAASKLRAVVAQVVAVGQRDVERLGALRTVALPGHARSLPAHPGRVTARRRPAARASIGSCAVPPTAPHEAPGDAAGRADAREAGGRDPARAVLRAEVGRLPRHRVPRRRRGGDRQPQGAPDDALLPRGGGGRPSELPAARGDRR